MIMLRKGLLSESGLDAQASLCPTHLPAAPYFFLTCADDFTLLTLFTCPVPSDLLTCLPPHIYSYLCKRYYITSSLHLPCSFHSAHLHLSRPLPHSNLRCPPSFFHSLLLIPLSRFHLCCHSACLSFYYLNCTLVSIFHLLPAVYVSSQIFCLYISDGIFPPTLVYHIPLPPFNA